MDDLSLYVKTTGKRTLYAFGPSWVSMALLMDDCGKPTEDEAVLEWYHEVYKKGFNNAGDKTSTTDNTSHDESNGGEDIEGYYP